MQDSQQLTYGNDEKQESRDRPSGSHEVYEQFYCIYGADHFVDQEDMRPAMPAPVVDGRVLHFDHPEISRATHLIVRQKRGISRYVRGQLFEEEPEFSYVSYPEKTFIVATTDGNSITRWHVRSAHGIVNDPPDAEIEDFPYNPIDRPYEPSVTTFHLDLSDQNGSRARLVYNSVDGNGTMEIDGQLGWILDARDSAIEKQVALQQIPDDVGHAALELTNIH